MKQRVVTRTRVIFIVVPIIILVLALFGGHILVWRLFSLSVVLLFLSFIWSRLGIRGLNGYPANPPEHCQVGDSFSEDILISNASLLPKLLLKAWQVNDLPGYTGRLALNLPPRGSYQWHVDVECRRRGKYHVGPLMLETTDPFGLFRVQRQSGETRELTVYPATVELGYRPVISQGGFVYTRNAWLAGGPRGMIARVREYTPGDSLSHIHWRSTAHTGQLMVKDYNTEMTKNTWLVMDMSGTRRPSDESLTEHGVSVTASLAKKLLDAGRPVGLITQGQDFYLLPLGVGESHFWYLMDSLALVEATGGLPVEGLIDRERKHLGSDSLVLVITDKVTDELVARLLRLNNLGTTSALVLPEGVQPEFISNRLATSGLPAYFARVIDPSTRTPQDLPFFMPLEN